MGVIPVKPPPRRKRPYPSMYGSEGDCDNCGQYYFLRGGEYYRRETSADCRTGKGVKRLKGRG